jgi:hypothetical protein
MQRDSRWFPLCEMIQQVLEIEILGLRLSSNHLVEVNIALQHSVERVIFILQCSEGLVQHLADACLSVLERAARKFSMGTGKLCAFSARAGEGARAPSSK